MPKEFYPSSFLCDCGYMADFFESTAREVREASVSSPRRLVADDNAHEIIFIDGEFAAVYCPNLDEEIEADSYKVGD